MKLKFPLLYIIIFVSTLTVSAQQYYNQQENFLNANNIWCFGHRAGLDFAGAVPVGIQSVAGTIGSHITSTSHLGEGAASVCDPSTGELLFYTDGLVIWNKNHQIMPNGDSLLGNDRGTTVQGNCIIPVIDSPGKYYVFSLAGPDQTITGSLTYNLQIGSLFYSVVDISLDSNLGDVEVGRKNIVLDTSRLSESMIAIPGCNNDIWLIVHDFVQPTFKSYHITKTGVDTIPIISTVAPWLSSSSQFSFAGGGMAVSPNRQYIAISSNYAAGPFYGFTGIIMDKIGVLLCKFNPQTGELFDAIEVDDNLTSYSIAFSSDNSKLYLTSVDYDTNQDTPIVLNQYDVSTFDSIAIASSKITITRDEKMMSYLRLHKDKIYISNSGNNFLSTINNPNLSGQACGYQRASITLLPNTYSASNLPSEVVYPLEPIDTLKLTIDTSICASDLLLGLDLEPSEYGPEIQYLWDDGTQMHFREINQPGIYWVGYRKDCETYVIDSFTIEVDQIEHPHIRVNGFTLSTSLSYTSYQWMLNGDVLAGAIDSVYEVAENGSYQVIVSNKSGCIDTSDIYEVTNVKISEIDQWHSSIKVYPNPSKDKIYVRAKVPIKVEITAIDGRALMKTQNMHENNHEIDITFLPSGVYFVAISTINEHTIKIDKIVKQ